MTGPLADRRPERVRARRAGFHPERAGIAAQQRAAARRIPCANRIPEDAHVAQAVTGIEVPFEKLPQRTEAGQAGGHACRAQSEADERRSDSPRQPLADPHDEIDRVLTGRRRSGRTVCVSRTRRADRAARQRAGEHLIELARQRVQLDDIDKIVSCATRQRALQRRSGTRKITVARTEVPRSLQIDEEELDGRRPARLDRRGRSG
jgi:hypothetical protein